MQIYRDRPRHLADACGGYMVLPGPATSAGLRTERAKRMIETHRRRVHLAEHARTADTQWAEAIIAADPLWGRTEIGADPRPLMTLR